MANKRDSDLHNVIGHVALIDIRQKAHDLRKFPNAENVAALLEVVEPLRALVTPKPEAPTAPKPKQAQKPSASKGELDKATD